MSERPDETWHRLLNWTYGQAPAERLSAQVIHAEGFEEIDPSHPLGGKDRGKDALIRKNGEIWIMATYFPRGQQRFAAIKRKLLADYASVSLNDAKGMAFVTNQELRLAERGALKGAVPGPVDLFHLDRTAGILERPEMQSVRARYLYIDPNGESAQPGAVREPQLSLVARSTTGEKSTPIKPPALRPWPIDVERIVSNALADARQTVAFRSDAMDTLLASTMGPLAMRPTAADHHAAKQEFLDQLPDYGVQLHSWLEEYWHKARERADAVEFVLELVNAPEGGHAETVHVVLELPPGVELLEELPTTYPPPSPPTYHPPRPRPYFHSGLTEIPLRPSYRVERPASESGITFARDPLFELRQTWDIHSDGHVLEASVGDVHRRARLLWGRLYSCGPLLPAPTAYAGPPTRRVLVPLWRANFCLRSHRIPNGQRSDDSRAFWRTRRCRLSMKMGRLSVPYARRIPRNGRTQSRRTASWISTTGLPRYAIGGRSWSGSRWGWTPVRMGHWTRHALVTCAEPTTTRDPDAPNARRELGAGWRSGAKPYSRRQMR